ncbi:MAG: hypothetical protein EA415_03115 [Sphaerobacteraceae bacterium]|nr:MAG: hypothetical protein EA415_03115 [Sphaerobacteraceae bacterium]
MPEEARGPAGEQDEQPDQRSGEDIRRRGWYWHWNSIVTQYAPLIGLKGIGLLNSYTVWTDRREDSPHRGYAFPSQQAESVFYGEDRAELITINKLLVALDLIEVRKEMVLHADAKGRRWRVPHNLYRVKDNANGFNLTVEDVLRVAELALKTPAVYRYIRRVFSPNFSPIDPNNPWHEILPAVRQTETWQKLTAKAAREDARASARSKAGHKKRKGKADTATQHVDSSGAQPQEEDVAQFEDDSTSVASSNIGHGTSVRGTNNGSTIDVAESNRAFDLKTQTIDAVINEGGSTVVEPANRTYNQETLNTTTTTTDDDLERHQDAESGYPPAGRAGDGAGPVLQASATVLAAFESANDRSATTLERELLGELERDFADAAQRVDQSPSVWVVDAIREAVNSGSRFVAPKRIREILSRWSTANQRGVRTRAEGSESGSAVGRASSSTPRSSRRRKDELGSAWRSILTELQSTSVWADVGDVLAGSAIAGENQGRIRIEISSPSLSEEMQAYLRQEIEPRFIDYLERTISLQFEVAQSSQQDNQPPGTAPDGEGQGPETAASDSALAGPLPTPRFSIADGLTNAQVWAAAQEELRGRVSSANFETWIRPASLIGRDAQDRLVLGVPNRFAQQRIESKLLPDIQAVVSNIVGQPVEVVVAISRQWLRENGT